MSVGMATTARRPAPSGPPRGPRRRVDRPGRSRRVTCLPPGRRATRTRSRPARSRWTATSRSRSRGPAPAAGPAWSGASSRTRAPPGSSQSSPPATSCSRLSRRSGRPRGAPGLVVADLRGEGGVLRFGHVRAGSTRSPRASLASRRVALRTTSPRPGAPGTPRPAAAAARLARATCQSAPGWRRWPTPRPRAARRPGPGPGRRCPSRGRPPTHRPPAGSRAASLVDGHLGHDLGLGPGDQHPAVDQQVQPPEGPAAEHVLQRLPGQAALHHRREPGRARPAVAVLRPPRPVEAARLLHQPPGLHGGQPGGRLGVELDASTAPGGAGLSPRSLGAPASWAARSASTRASRSWSRSPWPGPGRACGP